MFLEDMTEGYIEPYTCHCCLSETHLRSSSPCYNCKRNADANVKSETYKDWYKMKVEPTLSEQFYETEPYYGPGCHPDEDAIKGNFKTLVDVPIADMVNKPKHYLFGGLELIEIIDALLADGGFSPTEGFYVATILQYIVRFPKKNGLQDLEKARFYLNRLIEIKNRNYEEE